MASSLKFAPGTPPEQVNFHLHMTTPMKLAPPPPGLPLLLAYLRCLSPNVPRLLQQTPLDTPTPAILVPLVSMPTSARSQTLQARISRTPPAVAGFVEELRGCLDAYKDNGGPGKHAGGINQEGMKGQLRAIGKDSLLVLVVHSVQAGVYRRMWNVSAVVAALRAHFKPRAHIIAWDASLTAAPDLELMAALHRRADVLVTGQGLFHAHQLLLRPHAQVVQIETHGVAWEGLEVQQSAWDVLAPAGFTPYSASLLRSGWIANKRVDYETLRSVADYRVNLRALVHAVAHAITRMDALREVRNPAALASHASQAGQAQGAPGQQGNGQSANEDDINVAPVPSLLQGSAFAPLMYQGEDAAAQLLEVPLWGAAIDMRYGPVPRDAVGKELTLAQKQKLSALCPKCIYFAAVQTLRDGVIKRTVLNPIAALANQVPDATKWLDGGRAADISASESRENKSNQRNLETTHSEQELAQESSGDQASLPHDLKWTQLAGNVPVGNQFALSGGQKKAAGRQIMGPAVNVREAGRQLRARRGGAYTMVQNRSAGAAPLNAERLQRSLPASPEVQPPRLSAAQFAPQQNTPLEEWGAWEAKPGQSATQGALEWLSALQIEAGGATYRGLFDSQASSLTDDQPNLAQALIQGKGLPAQVADHLLGSVISHNTAEAPDQAAAGAQMYSVERLQPHRLRGLEAAGSSILGNLNGGEVLSQLMAKPPGSLIVTPLDASACPPSVTYTHAGLTQHLGAQPPCFGQLTRMEVPCGHQQEAHVGQCFRSQDIDVGYRHASSGGSMPTLPLRAQARDLSGRWQERGTLVGHNHDSKLASVSSTMAPTPRRTLLGGPKPAWDKASNLTQLFLQQLPKQQHDNILAEASLGRFNAKITQSINQMTQTFTKHRRWRDYLHKLDAPVDPAVVAVLRALFPPSSHACYGKTSIQRQCHYTNVVSYKSRFYYLREAPGTPLLKTWPTHRFTWFADHKFDYIAAITYAQFFHLLAANVDVEAPGDADGEWAGDPQFKGVDLGVSALPPDSQLAVLLRIIGVLRVRDLMRALLVYPFNTLNLYHFPGEVLPHVHMVLCLELGACRYWNATRHALVSVEEQGSLQQGADQSTGQNQPTSGRVLSELGNDHFDPSLRVALEPSDYTVIMWAETLARFDAKHQPKAHHVNREDRSFPAIFDFLRCFHPKGALWMTLDVRGKRDMTRLITTPPEPIGHAADLSSALPLLLSIVQNSTDAQLHPLNIELQRIFDKARLGQDEALEEWGDNVLLRVQHLVGGYGAYMRMSDGQEDAHGALPGMPASLLLSYKRRMVECTGGAWEDNLRLDLDDPVVNIVNRKDSREFKGIGQQAAALQQRLNGRVRVAVDNTHNAPLPEQVIPFRTPAVTLMSHGAALGMLQFVPLLTSWVDVTFGRGLRNRRFVHTYTQQTPAWEIPVLWYKATNISEFEFLDIVDDYVELGIKQEGKKLGGTPPAQILQELKAAGSNEGYKEVVEKYGLSDRPTNRLFILDINYKLDPERLYQQVRGALALALYRLLPDLLSGMIRPSDPEAVIALLEQITYGQMPANVTMMMHA